MGVIPESEWHHRLRHQGLRTVLLLEWKYKVETISCNEIRSRLAPKSNKSLCFECPVIGACKIIECGSNNQNDTLKEFFFRRTDLATVVTLKPRPGHLLQPSSVSSNLSTWNVLTGVTEEVFSQIGSRVWCMDSIIHGFPVLTFLVPQRAQLVLGFRRSSWAGEFSGPLQSTLKEDNRIPPWGPLGPTQSLWKAASS